MFISHKLDEVLRDRRRDHRDPPRHHRRHRRPEDDVTDRAAGRDDGRQRAARRPETRESTVHRPRRAGVEGLTRRRRGRPGRLVDDVDLTVRAGEVSASPASRATARPSWSRRSWACGRRRRAGSCSAATTSPRWARGRRREAGIGYIPEDRHRQGLLLAAAVGEPDPRPPDPPAGRARRLVRSTARRPRATPSGSSREFDVRTPGRRRAGGRAVRRQPAEAHRRPRDERPTRCC